MGKKVCALLVQLSGWAVRLSMRTLTPQASCVEALELLDCIGDYC